MCDLSVSSFPHIIPKPQPHEDRLELVQMDEMDEFYQWYMRLYFMFKKIHSQELPWEILPLIVFKDNICGLPRNKSSHSASVSHVAWLETFRTAVYTEMEGLLEEKKVSCSLQARIYIFSINSRVFVIFIT